MDCSDISIIWWRFWTTSLLFETARNRGRVYFLMILNFTRFPLSAILGWYDAYRYLMMNENEFDRKYNSQNFRDRYGNRRTEPRVQETRRGKYILMDEDNVTTQGRTGYFDLIKSKNKVKVISKQE